ncbi:beta-phosphoglucomutase-like phosphatase (HAD superfamily) [Mycobacterium frederiksbergense]|uniref:Beta-phosphoglucomutase-like phosphatase (HAD superfamily) n=1 Tax=Mycolicibacterium frederiksbergense TaxID=117567 RepID=A0ABT6L4E7_9MYCO|nr:HAD family hydrolase [Mycolicibacterium frederiksbergense]MDH6197805.1 beta-phosphoglucomutase-like phosphatase (HAD superfamily) [Mycolicibacterium frederiksbergense]
MSSPQTKSWRAGRFWWDCSRADTSPHPLRAVIFDLDALSDLGVDGHRVVFNAAFAAHGLPIEWGIGRYQQLLALPDERQRVAAELRKRCVVPDSDVLTQVLADEICMTKDMMFDEMILDVGLTPRPGLDDLAMDAFSAGVPVGVIAAGRRRWAEPLVRQLVGEGLVETVVTADDVSTPGAGLYRHALAELGVAGHDALAMVGSAAGLRAANGAGLASVLIDPDSSAGSRAAAHARGAAAVRADYAGADALRLPVCQRLHSQWWGSRSPSAA